jgi:23S rRNA (uracil1939-C5)-methyltransferase
MEGYEPLSEPRMKRPDRSARARPARAHGKPAPVVAETVLTPHEIGARGDAVAASPAGPLYLAGALPGEEVRARVAGDRGEVIEILTPSPQRVAPPCPHFGRCGGCQLQHWDEAAALAWKRDLVVSALAKRGLDVEVDPIVPAWGEGRRRAAFHAMRTPKGVRFGFMTRGSAGIIGIGTCPVLAPRLQAALPALAKLGAAFAPARGDATMPTLLTEAGLDVEIKGAGGIAAFDHRQLEAAAALAAEAGLARLSFDGEPFLTRQTPIVPMGRAKVAPPPGAFLQPTEAGEAALVALVRKALAGAERAADLFCGIGTFALPLAENCEVLAVEGEEVMLKALKAAADGAGGALKTVTTLRRDLLRAPISALELKRHDAIVFDPPRSGARLQAEQIAASKASRVAAVSCDAATFARDVRILVDAGFKLQKVTPVDQFRWSNHVEIVAALTR